MNALNTKVEALGLTLTNFVIENVSLPEEVEKAMDKRTSMGVLGDMGKYAQFQAAEAMRDAANNPNGMAGMGVGMGAGMSMGQMFTQAFGGAQQQVPAAPAAPAAATVACTACGQPIAAGSKFCSSCGAKQEEKPAGGFCPNCGGKVEAGSKFCPNCGNKMA